MLNKLFNIARAKGTSSSPDLALRLAQGGFWVPSTDQVIRWADIKRIICFKRDLLTTDLICIEILTKVPGFERIELNEDMVGFDDFCLGMSTILSDEFKDWRRDVIAPAFATNEQIIYKNL